MNVRDCATVRVSDPVDGTKHRRGGPHQTRASSVVESRVAPALLAAARAALRPGERLVIVSATEVRTVAR